MPFIPHTPEETGAMLGEIGVADMETLFDEIPVELRSDALERVPPGMSEMAMLRWMAERAGNGAPLLCFAGAGSYDHHIPAAVWDLAQRGEFMTAYTPYQAEASQGTLQAIFEYQSMMSELTAMEVSNASVYDGASGLGEAVLMAVRANRRARGGTVLLAESVHPHYREVVSNIVGNQGVQTDVLPVRNGALDVAALGERNPVAAVVVQQPNFFGLLEQVDAVTDWAHERGALVIALVNPMTLSVLKPPGLWGVEGADIACGDGQPLGVPMASGGPSFGFLCCRKALVRQMPGRLVGRTVDLDGKAGYTLTLQAREQHIRRGKATSNICTNQGLLVTAATIHMALLGAAGLGQVALGCRNNTRTLVDRLTRVRGVATRFDEPFFHECAVDLPVAAQPVLEALIERGVLGGVALGGYFPDMANTLLVCATEKRTGADIETYGRALEEVLS
ncbi:MAG: aminomethyl-transferring glycine dehydrogenase subunit GcvPA [Gammaproteobacteria bacterium]|nr:aminomethyl-transferring glycine dehydrogenase subunit GcvPA [Gammaproteobacteria bacterium]